MKRILKLLAIQAAFASAAFAEVSYCPIVVTAFAKRVVAEALRHARITNTIEVIPAIMRKDVDFENFDIPFQPIGELPVAVWGREDTATRLMGQPYSSWRIKVGYISNPLSGISVLKDECESKGIELSLVEFGTPMSEREALMKGEIDGIMATCGEELDSLAKIFDLGSLPYYFAVRKGTVDFARLDRSFTDFKARQINFFDGLEQELFDSAPPENRIRVALPIRKCIAEQDGNGRLSGAAIQWLTRIAAINGWTLDYLRCPTYESALEYVSDGSVDLVTGVQIRKDVPFSYAQSIVGYLRLYIVCKTGSQFNKRDPMNWRGASVAAIGYSKSARQLQETSNDFGNGLRVVECKSEEESFEKFRNGECDLLLTTDPVPMEGAEIICALPPIPYYVCASKKRPWVIDQLDSALLMILSDEPYLVSRIDKRFCPVPEGFGCQMDFIYEELVENMNANGEKVTFSIEGIKNIPDEITGIDNINTVFEQLLAEKLKSLVGFNSEFIRNACNDRDQIIRTWRLNYMWKDEHGLGSKKNAGKMTDTIRIDLHYSGDPFIARLAARALDSLEVDELLSYAYHAVNEGRDRPLFTNLQVWFIIAGIMSVAILLLIAAFIRVRLALYREKVASQARSRFLATISHEIRTPLNAIIGFSEHLNDDIKRGNAGDSVTGIMKSSEVLLSLINDVLDLSSLEHRKKHLRSGVCDLAGILGEASFVFAARAKDKGIDFRLDAAGIISDYELMGSTIRQIIWNILGNAVKYTEKGSVSAEMSVTGASAKGADDLVFRVTDTGCGISEEMIERVFDPLVRDIASFGGRIYEGTGLGLPIVKRLAEALDGGVEIQSAVGEGTTVTVRVPNVRRIEHTQNAGGGPFMSASEAAPLAGKGADAAAALTDEKRAALNVVAVDDIMMNVKILRLHLEKARIGSVRVFTDPAAALEAMKEEPADILFSDMWMPGMDGSQLAKKCRESERLKNMRIVAVTADTDSGQTFDMSVFDFVINKPLTFAKVDNCLAECVAKG